jgi:hypothetical protein
MRRHPDAIQVSRKPGCFRWLASAPVLVALGGAVIPAGAEEPTRVTADADVPRADRARARDRAALAAIGLDLARIEQTDDAALLWRAVRELVLPGRVSEATQQRILRRVWLADPSLRDASRIDSTVN